MKVGLMLGGGGAFGAYQIGVIKALMKQKLFHHVKVISGTSIGAINAIMVMAGLTIDEMEELWHKINNEIIYKNDNPHFQNEQKSLVNVGPLYQLLTSDLSAKTVKNSKYIGYATLSQVKNPNVINQISLLKTEKVVMKLNDADNPFKVAQGSASIPMLFGCTKIDDSYYVDGGVTDNNPIEPLIEEGCDLIIAIPLTSSLKIKKIPQANITVLDFKNNDIFNYTFLANFIKSVNFKQEMIVNFIKEGYDYGMKVIKELKKLKIIVDNEFKIDNSEFRYYNYEKISR